MCMGLSFIMKDGKQSNTPMRGQMRCNYLFQTMQLVENCRPLCGISNILSSFLQGLRKHFIPNYEVQKNKHKFELRGEFQTLFEKNSKTIDFLTCIMHAHGY